MRNFKKTAEEPDCLKEQKKLKTGKYDCGKVVEILQKDFQNKCYICEDKDITNLNIEHFVPKSLGVDYKFDWKNLFYSCRHCNSIKSDDFNTKSENEILNCLDEKANVLGGIKYIVKNRIRKEIYFEAINSDLKTKNTVAILDLVHNNISTPQRLAQSKSLRIKIIKEIHKFESLFENSIGLPTDEETVEEITKNLKKKSPFSAFKIWYFIEEFGKENLKNFIEKEEFDKFFV